MHLLHGRILDAFLMNPGLALFAIGLAVHLVRIHLAYRATGVWPATPPRDATERRRLSWMVGAAIAANWIYVVWHEANL